MYCPLQPQFFLQFSTTKFYKSSSVVRETFMDGQTDGQSDICRHLAEIRSGKKIVHNGIGLYFKRERSGFESFAWD